MKGLYKKSQGHIEVGPAYLTDSLKKIVAGLLIFAFAQSHVGEKFESHLKLHL